MSTATRRAKIYRRHYCKRNHRSYATIAKCLWPKNIWISGDGPWATISNCRGTWNRSVQLHLSERDARLALDMIDSYACGGRCSRSHELVKIEIVVG